MVSAWECAHKGVTKPFAARVRLAHSIADVERNTAENDGLTVALTFGAAGARDELVSWAVQRRVLTIVSPENQCVSCAVALGRAIGALLVVT